MNTVRVDLGDRGYDVQVGTDLDVGVLLSVRSGTKILVVTDDNVNPLYGERCLAQLTDAGAEPSVHVVAAGEDSKKIGCLKAVYDCALANGLDRKSMILALGGGVVGDLAGFAAATFMRGIEFVQAPTSLLAMVDSSVGGKTGVNIPQGKNLIGSFYQPVLVAADINTLDTLPEREYACGMAEMIKYGVIWDAELFARLETESDAILARDKDVMTGIVARCCEIKAEVVTQDERESGVRAVLNFGHTLGHAVENSLGYGTLNHGEAVAVGMVYAAKVSEKLLGMPAADSDRITALVQTCGLPTSLGDVKPDWGKMRSAIAVDKKTEGSVPKFVLSEAVGKSQFGCEVDEALLAEVYDDLC